MAKKPTYEQLEQMVKELEKESFDLKHAVADLGKPEENYRSMIEHTNDLITITTFSLKPIYTYISPSHKKIMGYEPEDLIGKSIFQFIHPDDKKRLLPLLKKYLEMVAKRPFTKKDLDFTERIDCRVKCKSGNWRYLQSTVNLIGKNMLFISRDITEKKKIEEKLTKSEAIYRTLATNAPIGIYYNDFSGEFIYGNRKAEEIIGYKSEELIGKNFLKLKLLHFKDLTKAAKLLALNKLGKATGPDEFTLYKKDGSKVTVEINTEIITIGEKKAVLGMVQDITDRKQAEEEKAKLQTQLHQAQKMETIGILAGGVAHDLNNILSGIISYPELLLLDLPEDSPLRKPLLTIKSSGEKAADVVQDLLTMARRGIVITEVVNLNSIISEQLKSPEFEKLKSFHPNVDIKTNLEKNLLNIKGSTAHLSKTVFNLISNAAEAMPDGGKVLISTENQHIDRPIKGYDHVAEGDYVVVTVSDTGIGISKKDMNRIFEPFYTKKVMGRSGTGLGMPVVWGTVKDHKGYIDVKSTKGKGTTFTFYFPVIRQELAIDKSFISIEDYMGKGESILIVDDVEEQREIASGMLKKLGYSVTSVSSGEEAIKYMKDNSADLLVLDMIMDPGIDGLDTYKKILELYPKQKAIIASGFSETDRVKEAKRLGAGAYVKKPYVLEKIGVVIKEELEK